MIRIRHYREGMAQQVVNNNLDGMVQIQLPSENPSSKGQTVQLGPILTLLPGNNQVDKDKWEKAKMNPTVVALLAERIVATNAPEQNAVNIGRYKLVEGKTYEADSPLTGMKAPEAKRFIEETLDTGLLKVWLTVEKRAEIRKTVQEQIDAIDNPPDAVVARGATPEPV